jgi:hypothetical protein
MSDISKVMLVKKKQSTEEKKLLAYLIIKADGFLLSIFKLNFLLLNYKAVKALQ